MEVLSFYSHVLSLGYIPLPTEPSSSCPLFLKLHAAPGQEMCDANSREQEEEVKAGEGMVNCEGEMLKFPGTPPVSPPGHFSFPFAPLFLSLLLLSLVAWFVANMLSRGIQCSISGSLERLLIGFKCVLKTPVNPNKALGELLFCIILSFPNKSEKA